MACGISLLCFCRPRAPWAIRTGLLGQSRCSRRLVRFESAWLRRLPATSQSAWRAGTLVPHLWLRRRDRLARLCPAALAEESFRCKRHFDPGLVVGNLAFPRVLFP